MFSEKLICLITLKFNFNFLNQIKIKKFQLKFSFKVEGKKVKKNYPNQLFQSFEVKTTFLAFRFHRREMRSKSINNI